MTFLLRTAWDPNGYPANIYTTPQNIDLAAYQDQWFNALQLGRGSTFGIPGSRISLGDGSLLPSSLIVLNISRVDPNAVFAYLQFSYNYRTSGAYQVRFEGCCRSENILNNAGGFWSIQSNLTVMPSYALSSPIISMPPVIQLTGSNVAVDFASFSCNAVHKTLSSLFFRVGSPSEMGGAADPSFQYSSPTGLSVDQNGLVTMPVGIDACPDPSSSCLYQVTIVVQAEYFTSQVDFLVQLVSTTAPAATYSGYLITPPSSRANPITIQCGTAEFLPPVNTTFRVSDCVDLSEDPDFPCSSFRGVCPAQAYAFVRPYYLPQYERCPPRPPCSCAIRQQRASSS